MARPPSSVPVLRTGLRVSGCEIRDRIVEESTSGLKLDPGAFLQ
jgi:hypothetical protein